MLGQGDSERIGATNCAACPLRARRRKHSVQPLLVELELPMLLINHDGVALQELT